MLGVFAVLWSTSLLAVASIFSSNPWGMAGRQPSGLPKNNKNPSTRWGKASSTESGLPVAFFKLKNSAVLSHVSDDVWLSKATTHCKLQCSSAVGTVQKGKTCHKYHIMFLEAKQRCKKKNTSVFEGKTKKNCKLQCYYCAFCGLTAHKNWYLHDVCCQEKVECTKHCFWTLKRWYLRTFFRVMAPKACKSSWP